MLVTVAVTVTISRTPEGKLGLTITLVLVGTLTEIQTHSLTSVHQVACRDVGHEKYHNSNELRRLIGVPGVMCGTTLSGIEEPQK